MDTDLLIILPALIGALIATGLFLYGFWQIVKTYSFHARLVELARTLKFIRSDENPIITTSGHPWEAGGVMNPAAMHAGGKTHLFYRAVGNDGVSRVGYATSDNGMKIDQRFPYPVFALAEQSERPSRDFAAHKGLLASGGSFAGVEDPRAVVIDDTMYLSFNAFAGWNSLRVGISSIKLDDVLAKRWKWTPPVYLSPTGQVHKNWVLFPEKINGKFAVLHNLHTDSPDRVRIEYIDNLETYDANKAPESPDPQQLPDRLIAWHTRMRSAGPPPIKTKDGWLVLYHATDTESHRYKMGALLLDSNDPTRVIARAPLPVLTPDASYENEGKPGIVYACGATLVGDTLRVYYGGADKVGCVAKTSLSRLLKNMERTDAVHAAPSLLAIA